MHTYMSHNLKYLLMFSIVPGKHSEMLAVVAPVFSSLSYNDTNTNTVIFLNISNFNLELHMQRKVKQVLSEYIPLLGRFY